MTLPASWTRVPVVGTFRDLHGAPCKGRITFTSSQVVVIDGLTVVPKVITAELVDGSLPDNFELPATNDPDLSPTGWAYQVREKFDGGRSYGINVPYDAVSVDLATVAPVFVPDAHPTVLHIALNGLSLVSGAAITAADTILSAFGKLQKQITNHLDDVGNPHAVTKTQVGLGNVDNTADANKPVSTAQAVAIAAVQTSVNDHVVDASSAHAASAISNTPAGGIAATTVQAAINELDTEKQPVDVELTALAGLSSAADTVPYFTGLGTAALAGFTAAGRALLDDADVAAQRTTLGLGNVENKSSATIRGELTSGNITTALSYTPVDSAMVGAASGVAPLDAGGKVASAYLPGFVDDVLEVANFSALPGTGEGGKIYVALDTGQIYRWGGSVYVEISASPGSTDAVPEGSTNLYHTGARVRGTLLDGLSLATATVISAGDSLLAALGKLQGQVSVLDVAKAALAGAAFTGAVSATAFTGPLTGNVTGNASTATALATARAINGVNFDGTAAITVTAAAGTLTGTALAATVVSASINAITPAGGTVDITGNVALGSGYSFSTLSPSGLAQFSTTVTNAGSADLISYIAAGGLLRFISGSSGGNTVLGTWGPDGLRVEGLLAVTSSVASPSPVATFTNTGTGYAATYKTDGFGIAKFTGPEYAQVQFTDGTRTLFFQVYDNVANFGCESNTPVVVLSNNVEIARFADSAGISLKRNTAVTGEISAAKPAGGAGLLLDATTGTADTGMDIRWLRGGALKWQAGTGIATGADTWELYDRGGADAVVLQVQPSGSFFINVNAVIRGAASAALTIRKTATFGVALRSDTLDELEIISESDGATIATFAPGGVSATTRFNLPSFTVATLPAAGAASGLIFVSDEAGGAVPAFSDGTNWRRVTDRAVVS